MKIQNTNLEEQLKAVEVQISSGSRRTIKGDELVKLSEDGEIIVSKGDLDNAKKQQNVRTFVSKMFSHVCQFDDVYLRALTGVSNQCM